MITQHTFILLTSILETIESSIVSYREGSIPRFTKSLQEDLSDYELKLHYNLNIEITVENDDVSFKYFVCRDTHKITHVSVKCGYAVDLSLEYGGGVARRLFKPFSRYVKNFQKFCNVINIADINITVGLNDMIDGNETISSFFGNDCSYQTSLDSDMYDKARISFSLIFKK